MPDNIITLSTGVRVRVGWPQPKAIADLYREMDAKKPKPPVVFIEDKGRKEENPSDPDYREARWRYQAELAEAVLGVIIATGLTVESLPEGFLGPDSPDFAETLALMGIAVPASKQLRFARWVNYFAAPTPSDGLLITGALLPKVGTTEEDVATAQATFPGDTPRGADRKPVSKRRRK